MVKTIITLLLATGGSVVGVTTSRVVVGGSIVIGIVVRTVRVGVCHVQENSGR